VPLLLAALRVVLLLQVLLGLAQFLLGLNRKVFR
jgi:hypothetical protein